MTGKDNVRKFIQLPIVGSLAYYLLILFYIIKNNWPIRPKKTPWVCSLGEYDPLSRIDYAREVFRDYLNNSGLEEGDIAGKRILEIGTGENLCVAALFFAYGAERVDTVDAFKSLLPLEKQKELNGLLLDNLPAEKQGRLKSIIDQLTKSDYKSGAINYYNTKAEDLVELEGPYDIIISRAVMEHVKDPEKAIQAMDAVLNRGGKMIHEIDFRDHGMFTRLGLNALTFLCPGKNIWRLMTSRIGAPNRCLINNFIDYYKALNYQLTVKVPLLLGQAEKADLLDYSQSFPLTAMSKEIIDSARNKINIHYKKLDDRVLATAVAVIVADKR